MNEQTITQLIKLLLEGDELSQRFRNKILFALDPNVRSVHYDLSDMEDMIDRANEIEGLEIYSKDNAMEALEAMVDNYDPEYGINYYTYDHFIEHYCSKEEE